MAKLTTHNDDALRDMDAFGDTPQELLPMQPQPQSIVDPLEALADEDYEALGEPHKVSAEDMRSFLYMVVQGVNLEQMGTSLGFSPSQIKSISEDGKIIGIAKQSIIGKARRRLRVNDLIDTLQLSSLEQIAVMLPNMNPMETLATFAKLNAAKKQNIQFKPAEVQDALHAGAVADDVVELTIPPPHKPVFKVNDLNQITEVEGKELRTLSTKELNDLVASKGETMLDYFKDDKDVKEEDI